MNKQPDTEGPNSDGPIAWIRTNTHAGNAHILGPAYKRLGVPPDGAGLDHVLKIHALMPETLEEHLGFYQGILRRPGPLTRTECEIIGVVVSDRNGCEY